MNFYSVQSTIFGSNISTITAGQNTVFSTTFGNQSNYFSTNLSTFNIQFSTTVQLQSNQFSSLIGNQSNFYSNTFSTLISTFSVNTFAMTNNFSTAVQNLSNSVSTNVGNQITFLSTNFVNQSNYFSTTAGNLGVYFSTLTSTNTILYGMQISTQSGTLTQLLLTQSNYFSTNLSTQSNYFSTYISSYSNYFSTMVSTQGTITSNLLQNQSTYFGSNTSTSCNLFISTVNFQSNQFSTLLAGQSNYFVYLGSTQSTIFGNYTSTVSNQQNSTIQFQSNQFSTLLVNQGNYFLNVASTQSTIFGNYTSTLSNLQTSSIVGNSTVFSTLIWSQSNTLFNIFSTQSTIFSYNTSTISNTYSTILGAQSNTLAITVLSSQGYNLGLWSTQSTDMFINISGACNYFSTTFSSASNYFSSLAVSNQGYYIQQFTIQSSYISSYTSTYYGAVFSTVNFQNNSFSILLSTQQGIFSTVGSTQSNYFSSLISSQTGFFAVQSVNQQTYFNSQISNLSTFLLSNVSTLSNYFSTNVSTFSNVFTVGTSTTVGYFSTILSTQLGQILSTVSYQSNFYSTQVAVLNSTFSTQNAALISSLNSNISSYSTYLGNTLSTQSYMFLSSVASTITISLIGINSYNNSTIYQSLSSFSTSVYTSINNGFSTISSFDFQWVNTVSNYVNDMCNYFQNSYQNFSTFVGTPINGIGVGNFPQVTNTCNALLGILSTTFSTFSSITNNFVQTNQNISLTGNVNLTGTLTASQGVYSRFFNISNIVSTYTYFNTGAPQRYYPNPNANKVLVQLWGAGGARGSNTNGGGGAYVEGIFSANPALNYLLFVGGGGTLTSSANFYTTNGGTLGGYNGGGAGYSNITGSGGGATSLLVNNNNMDILAVAGGGGGGGFISSFNNWSGAVETQISSTTVNFNISNIAFYSNTNSVGAINSTIFMPIGSWGGPGGIARGCNATSPIGVFSTGPFSLGGQGGPSSVMFSTPTSNTIVRNATTPNVNSTLIYISTFYTFKCDFVPGLMGTSPYDYPSLSTLLSTSYQNTSNYTIISTNVNPDAYFLSYSNTLVNDPNYPIYATDSMRAMLKTVYDFYNFSNTLEVMPAGAKRFDYTDQTPTAIYAADLTITLTPIGYPYGIAVNMIPFPFDASDPLKFSTARNYLLSTISSINATTSATNLTGLQYFDEDGVVGGQMTSSYNGSYVTEGNYGDLMNRYMYYDINNLSTYGFQIKPPVWNSAAENTWRLSSFTSATIKQVQNYQLMSSIYARVFCNSLPTFQQLPTFLPDVSTNFYGYQAGSSLVGLINTPSFAGISTSYATVGQADLITGYFNTNTQTPYLSSLYNIFISSAGPAGASLYSTLPLAISGSKINIQATSNPITTYVTNTMPQYISNWFTQNNFFNEGFAVNDVTFTIRTLGDFPTIKFYEQKVSTVSTMILIGTSLGTTQNTIFYGSTGSAFMGGVAYQSTSIGTIPVTYAGGGGSGWFGGAAGAVTQTQSQYIIGGGGGGGGSSYIAPLTTTLSPALIQVSTTGYSLPGNGTSSGFATHPTVLANNIGTGGFDVNSLNNWLSTYTVPLAANTHAYQSGGNGLIILTEFVDPMIVSISSGSQNFTPLRIEALTNQLVVNKIVISSAQNITVSNGPSYNGTPYTDDFSTAILDFGNYQQFYINFYNSTMTQTLHVSNLNVNTAGMNYQTGQIILNILSTNANAKFDFSTNFVIDTSWTGANFTTAPGILTAGNLGVQKMEYTIFNNTVYLAAPTYF